MYFVAMIVMVRLIKQKFSYILTLKGHGNVNLLLSSLFKLILNKTLDVHNDLAIYISY